MSAHFRRVWAWPIALAVLSASGLASALVSDDWGDGWSWLALGLPLVIAARHSLHGAAR